jgi:ABC-2 type transport system ATP-binding protein
VEILDLLRRLAHERGIAILLSSHLLSQVQSVCDRVGIFAAGKLIGSGTVEDLAARFGEAQDLVEVGLDLGPAVDRGAAAAPLLGVLRRLDGAREVRLLDGRADTVVVQAEPAAAGRVRTAILALAASGTLPLTSVRQVPPSLDDIYRHALEQRGLAGTHGEVAA